jgi:hypothetical protein
MVIAIFDLLVDQLIPECLRISVKGEQSRALVWVIGQGEENFRYFLSVYLLKIKKACRTKGLQAFI